MLSAKENMAVMNKLKQIVMLGRQAGFFIILACQRPDAKYLQDGIRDQFNFRVALGRMSELGYSMEDVAVYYVEETGQLGEVPSNLQNYIDYQSLGRDMELEGNFLVTSNGVFEYVE